jgi:O-antigen/teichoic acid export membrane protein
MKHIHYKSFISHNLIVILGAAFINLKGVILMPIIIKSGGVTIYGGFMLLVSILGITYGVSSLGAGFRAKRYLPSVRTADERSNLFYPQFYFHFIMIGILSLLLVLLKNPLNSVLLKNEVTYSIWVIPAYLLSFFLYSQGSDYFRYTSRIHYMTIAILCYPYLHIAFILIYLNLYGSIGIDALILSSALSALLIAVPSFRMVFRENGVKLRYYKRAGLISDIRLGFPLILGFMVDFILAGSDRYLIAIYLSVTDVGYYVPGYVLGSLIIFLPKAMGTVLPQLLTRAVDGGNEGEARTMLNYAVKLFLLLAIPFAFGCLAVSKPVLTLLANQEVAQKAFWIAPIVAVGAIFYGLSLILSNALFVKLRTKAIFKMNLLAAIVNLAANAIFIFIFRSLIVAAITTLLSYLIALIYAYRIVSADWPINLGMGTIIKSVAASAVMLAIISAFKTQLVNLPAGALSAVVVGLGILVYSLCILGFRTFSSKELLFLRKLFAHQ